jgi:hypothetical protein
VTDTTWPWLSLVTVRVWLLALVSVVTRPWNACWLVLPFEKVVYVIADERRNVRAKYK